MAKRLQIQDIAGGTQLTPVSGGSNAFVRPLQAKVRTVKPLDFSPLIKGLQEQQKANNALQELKELNAAEEASTDEKYQGVLQSFSEAVKSRTSGVQTLSERNEITNRLWLQYVEAGQLPEGSGPRTLKKLAQHQAQLAAQRLEPELLQLVDQAGRGVDSEGNPITLEQIDQMIDEKVAEVGRIPAVQSLFAGSETYRQISEQLSARAHNQAQARLQEAQKEAAFAALGAVLRSGDDTGPVPFPGFAGMHGDEEWSPEKTQDATTYIEDGMGNHDSFKHRYVRVAADWLDEALATFAADGSDDEGDLQGLLEFVERVGDAAPFGAQLDLDESTNDRYSKSPAAVLSDMRIAIERQRERNQSNAARHAQEEDLAFARVRVEITRKIRDGATDPQQIFQALLEEREDTGILEALGDRMPGVSFANRVKNQIDATLEESRKWDAGESAANIQELERLSATMSFSALEEYAVAQGWATTPEYADWHGKNRGLAKLEGMGDQTILTEASNQYTQKLTPGLLGTAADDTIRKEAQRTWALDKQALAQSLEDAGPMSPDQMESFAKEWLASDETRKERVVAFNERIRLQEEQAKDVIRRIGEASASQNVPDLLALRDEASGLLRQDRLESLDSTISGFQATAEAFARPTAPRIAADIESLVRAGIVRSAEGDSVVQAEREGTFGTMGPRIRRMAADITTDLQAAPEGEETTREQALVAAAVDEIAKDLGISEAVEAIRSAPTPEEREEREFRKALSQGRQFVSQNLSYTSLEMPELRGTGWEGIEALETLRKDGSPFFFGPKGDAAFTQAIYGLGRDLATLPTPEDRSEEGIKALSWAYIPLGSVGGTHKVEAPYSGRSRTKESIWSDMKALGFSNEAVSWIRMIDPEGREFSRSLGAFKQEGLAMGLTVTRATRNVGSPVEIVLSINLDFTDTTAKDYRPMVTRYFRTVEEVNTASDEEIKRAFKTFNYPTEGQAYNERRDAFLAQQRRIIQYWQDI